MSKKESWRDIYPYDGKYQVSNLGRVRNARSGRILSHDIHKGYHRVKLLSDPDESGNKKLNLHFVHRLVALCFVPIYSLERNQINHIDGNKWNNVPENLEWCNNSENQLHRYRKIKTGYIFGDLNNRARLTSRDVKEIKAKYQTGDYTQRQLAKEYKVAQSAISQIVTNKIRKYD